MEISQYLSVFMDECTEHLQTLNQSLLELEGHPDNTELLNTIFRAAHTLKGASMTMGFNKMAAVTSAMEDVLSALRKKEIPVTSEVVNLLFECLDLLEVLAQGIASGREEDIEIGGVIQQLKRLSSGEETAPAVVTDRRREFQLRYTTQEREAITAALAEGATLWHVSVTLKSDCLLKGARAFMVLRELGRLGEVIKSVPDVKELEDEEFQDVFLVGLVSKEPREKIVQLVGDIIDVAQVVVERADLEAIPPERRAPREPVAMPEVPSPAKPGLVPGLPAGQTVRVDIRKLDDLMNLVGELVINRARLEQLCAPYLSRDLEELLEQVGRLTLELQNRVLKARMVPVDNVFRRFPRLVRDLCREMGKEAVLVIRGAETELDRTVIDEIGDPLMHILRNCVDHGIEPPAERQAKGKPPTGTITLEARQEGNSVVIVISDDGRGVDLEKVVAKAVEMNLVTQAQVDEMSREELLELVFAPGLSTAKKVSDVSGRGVGMDAVRAKIDSLRGTVSIASEEGRGTTVTIRLPLTLAIIQALMVELGDEVYFIPSSFIDSTISVLQKDIKKVRHQEVTMVRGEVLPLVRLQQVLGLPGAKNENYEELDVVVIRHGERRVGCIVDRLVRQQDVVLKPLGGFLGQIREIAGGTILGDGRVALVLDVRAVA